jgi:hypothetical protein
MVLPKFPQESGDIVPDFRRRCCRFASRRNTHPPMNLTIPFIVFGLLFLTIGWLGRNSKYEQWYALVFSAGFVMLLMVVVALSPGR